jgi:hypothetical protein
VAVKKFPESFEIDISVHHEFLPPVQIVTGYLYVQVLKMKRHDKWQGQWFLHQDNAPSHTSLVVQQVLSSPTTFLSGFRSEWLLAVPYSEDGLQGDTFRNHGGHQIECDGRTPED